MGVQIVVEASRCRRWHVELASTLATSGEAVVALTPGSPLPSSLESILALERLVFRLPSPRESDRYCTQAAEAIDDDVMRLDLTSSATGHARSLRVLYDGSPDETAIFGALLHGRAPTIQVVGGTENLIYAEGLPSVETAACLTQAYESVTAAASTLVQGVMRRMAGSGVQRTIQPSGKAPWRAAHAARYVSRTIAMLAVKWLYRLCTRAPHWRVGWRYVDGPGAMETGSLAGPKFQNLADPGTHFYADPFPVQWQGEQWLYVEDFDHSTQKAVISCIRFDEKGPVGPMEVALDLPWHLSYPFVFEEGGDLWMIPESSTDRTLRLYRACGAANKWQEEAILMSDIAISDATLHHDGDRYWLFGTVSEGPSAPSDALYIYSAESIRGPWLPHEHNPVVLDAASARPAGRLVQSEGRLYRPVQDCRSGYGRAVQIAEVTELSQSRFAQTIIRSLEPGILWPGRRLHTLNRAGNLECIDGSAISFRGVPFPWTSRDAAAASEDDQRRMKGEITEVIQ